MRLYCDSQDEAVADAERLDGADFEDSLGDDEAMKPGALPSYLIYPDGHPLAGEKAWIASLLKALMKKGHERKKSIERTGLGGGRVGNAPAHNRRQASDAVTADTAPAQPAAQSGGTELERAATEDGAVAAPVDEATIGELMHDDTVGVLFTIGGSPTFVVCEVARMKSSGGHTMQSGGGCGLSISELEDIRTSITVRPLASSCTATSPVALVFSGESSVAEQTVFGPFVQPLALTSGDHRGRTALSMETQVLNDAGIVIWLRVTANDNEMFPHVKSAPSSAAHKGANGGAMFVLGGDYIRRQVRVETGAGRLCGIGGCTTKVPSLPSEKVSHGSFHANCTSDQMRHTEMCYLCYGPASGCPVYLVKTSGAVLQPRAICKATDPSASETSILQSGIKMQMGRISVSTHEAPSSNAPIVCPECHPQYAEEGHKAPGAAAASSRKPALREAVWKYNMRAHWNRRHRNTPMPSGLSTAIALSSGEVSLLRQGRGFPVKRR